MRSLSYFDRHYNILWLDGTKIKIYFDRYISDKTVLSIIGNSNGTIVCSVISDAANLHLGPIKPTCQINRSDNSCTISNLQSYGVYIILSYDFVQKIEQY